MRVKIDEIGHDGRTVTDPLPAERFHALLAEAHTGYRGAGAVAVEVRLTRAGKRVVVEGHLESRVVAPCTRCLADIEVPIPADFVLGLRPAVERAPIGVEGEGPEDHGRGVSAGSFRLEDADEDFYEDEQIDLEPILREQLLLALPDYVHCSDDCKGLCTVCGADLNEAECGCDRVVPDPRLAKLKDLKL